MNAAPERLVEQPTEQLIYAWLLDWGTRAGLLVLVMSFGAYVLGLSSAHVPLERLARIWSHPVGTYLQETRSPGGWAWLALVNHGDVAALLGIAILAGCSLLCLLALVPLYLRRGDKAFAALCLAQVAVVLFAASGWLSGGTEVADVFTRPLLATEHGEFDTGAQALAFAIAQRCGRPLAAVLPVVSNPEFEMVAPQIAAKADAEAATRRQSLESRASALGLPFDLQVRHGPEAYQEIVDSAREHAADLLVIRRRGRRGLLANLLLGEMVHKVVAHAPCSVLVAPRAAQMWARQVLVGSAPQAPDLASASGLPAILDQARRQWSRVDGLVRLGRPHQENIAAAQACGADLLVVARHAGTPLAGAWIRGTAQKVIGLAYCPLLVHFSPPNPPEPRTATP